jgi:hypothetical protein
VTISLGYGDNEPIRFGLGDVSMKKGDLEGQLHEFARSLRVPLRERASVEDVISEFLASADR